MLCQHQVPADWSAMGRTEVLAAGIVEQSQPQAESMHAVCLCVCVCSNKTAKAEQAACTLHVCVCVCVHAHVCSNKTTKAEQEAYTLRVCVFKQESQGRPDSMHSACVCACMCVCSNKPVSQDAQNLISWRQLTVFKNRLLPMTFPSPLFCSDSKPAHSLLS